MFVTIRVEEEEERVEKILMVFCYTLGLHTQYNNNNNNITQCSYIYIRFPYTQHRVVCMSLSCVLCAVQYTGLWRKEGAPDFNTEPLPTGRTDIQSFLPRGCYRFHCIQVSGRVYWQTIHQPAYTDTDTHYHRIGRFESLVTERRGYYFFRRR